MATAPLTTEAYRDQIKCWPSTGRHILAHFDDNSIIVYQAYKPSIARFVIKHGRFGGDEFSCDRMSWIKPNFLWMMYRCGWGTKQDQEVTLGLRLRRAFFDELLTQAVPSSWDRAMYATKEEWSHAVATSSVRLQWDPDHDPFGAKQERRAIQLGMRGDVLQAFGQRELVEVIDLTELVAEQRSLLQTDGLPSLQTPRERVYLPTDAAVSDRLRLSSEE